MPGPYSEYKRLQGKLKKMKNTKKKMKAAIAHPGSTAARKLEPAAYKDLKKKIKKYSRMKKQMKRVAGGHMPSVGIHVPRGAAAPGDSGDGGSSSSCSSVSSDEGSDDNDISSASGSEGSCSDS